MHILQRQCLCMESRTKYHQAGFSLEKS